MARVDYTDLGEPNEHSSPGTIETLANRISRDYRIWGDLTPAQRAYLELTTQLIDVWKFVRRGK